jgi:thiol-disulfide isomerase/thioredoxin
MRIGRVRVGGRPLLFRVAAGCAFAVAATPASAPAGTSHTDAPGIDWYAGDVGGAFESARIEHKPVFLYWGAQWCPPCQQLKSSVFSRSDFIAKTRQFVAVYLDGDDPGAQQWGETFRVGGYPTVVILRADRREITRISGGMDLSLYADLLDIALGDVKPIAEVLAALRARPAELTHADCQRLAYYAWELGDYSIEERKTLAPALARAATTCADISSTERARLTVTAAVLSPLPDSVARIGSIIADSAQAPQIADVLEDLDTTFYAAVLAQGAAASAKFQSDWVRTMDRVAGDPRKIAADQLVAVGTKLALVKRFAPDGKVPAALAQDARARVAAALGQHAEPYVRAGVINAASFVDEQLGDDAAQYAMLRAEMRTAKTPYYYMADLGDVEERRGHRAEALAWYERAYRESRGAATRFQWGNRYLGALLRLAPTERQRIRDTAAAVIGELDGPERIRARTRIGLEKLDGRLRKWNEEHHYGADLQEIRRRMQGVCAKLPSNDAGLSTCRNFLDGAA